MHFASSTERLTAPGHPPRQLSLSRCLPPLVGLVRFPAFDRAVCVCTPSDVAVAFGLQAASAYGSRSVLVVSHDLDGLLHTPSEHRLFSTSSQRLGPRRLGTGRRPTTEVAAGPPPLSELSVDNRPGVSGCGLVASHCRTGFAAFLLAVSQSRRTTWSPESHRGVTPAEAVVAHADPRSFPQRGSHPSKKSSRQQPCPVTRTVALLSLCLHPSGTHKAYLLDGDPRLQGLAPLSGP